MVIAVNMSILTMGFMAMQTQASPKGFIAIKIAIMPAMKQTNTPLQQQPGASPGQGLNVNRVLYNESEGVL